MAWDAEIVWRGRCPYCDLATRAILVETLSLAIDTTIRREYQPNENTPEALL